MSVSHDGVHCVKAVYAFRGSNNDELVFSKGDVITVTQAIDGGWWEGTLKGKTGWFPSNYVKEYKNESQVVKERTGSIRGAVGDSGPAPSNMQCYHNVVLQNVIETERRHCADISSVLHKYIRPLRATQKLTTVNMIKIMDILEKIDIFKQNFMLSLNETVKLPHNLRRVGGVFMSYAADMKELFEPYCAHHPGAIADLQSHAEEIDKQMEELGAPSPGSLVLITCLSQPFTRLEKYASLLKELERHIEESHIDRGDTQRAMAVCRDLSSTCYEIRKRKEMEHEIVTSAIKDWEGSDITSLGEVLHISKGKLQSLTGEKCDRILIVYPSTLLLLSHTSPSVGYRYEGKIPLSGLQVTENEDKENQIYAVEFTGESLTEKLTFTCGTHRDMVRLIDHIQDQIAALHAPLKTPQSLPISSTSSITSTPTAAPSKSNKVVPTVTQPTFVVLNKPPLQKTWTMSCLCPAAPLRPVLNYNDTLPHRKSGNVRKKQDDPRMYEMDGALLRVIEAYCNSIKSRHTVGSSVFEAATIILPEEEKVIVEVDNGDNNQTIEEKSLVDTVYCMTGQIKQILQEQKRLQTSIDEERKARALLELAVRQLQKLSAKNVANGDVTVA